MNRFDQIDLKLLYVFVACAEEQHFARASKRLGVTSAAVAIQINKLEALCGQDLFVNTGSSRDASRLTAAGQALLPYARELFKLGAEAFDKVAMNPSGGEFRAIVAEDAAGVRVFEAVGELRQTYPKLRVALEVRRDVSLDALTREGAHLLVRREIRETRRAPEFSHIDATLWVAADVEQFRHRPLRLISAGPRQQEVKQVLAAANIDWRLDLQGDDLFSRRLGLQQRLGVSALPASLAEGLAVTSDETLPALSPTRVCLYLAQPTGPGFGRWLSRRIVESLEAGAVPQV